MFLENMIMNHAPERAGNHDILKVRWAVEGCNTDGKPLPDSEMTTLPSHLTAHPDKPFRDTGHGAFLSAFRRVHMSINAPGQIKYAFSRSTNQCGKFNDWHQANS